MSSSRARHSRRGWAGPALAALSILGLTACAAPPAAAHAPARRPVTPARSTAAARPAAVRPAAPGPAAADAARQASTASAAGPGPGFWYGTDSTGITLPGPAPYREPGVGGSYGGYIGMIGNWASWQHCGGAVVWSGADAAAADTNLATYRKGIGTGVYWFMAGPGVDPGYNGSTARAYAWGEAQAARALSDLGRPPAKVTYPVVFMDVELPGDAPAFTPAPDNGWNAVYTSPCSGRVRSEGIPAAVDRADFNGFAAYLTAHSRYRAGVYSEPAVWRSIFGSAASAAVTSEYEWTYAADTSSLAHRPAGWCLSGTSACAQFFGGMTAASSRAVMWQWSGGGGTRNGVGDLDQIDGSRTPAAG
jgi:hypothetical protein